MGACVENNCRTLIGFLQCADVTFKVKASIFVVGCFDYVETNFFEEKIVVRPGWVCDDDVLDT